MLVGYLRVSSEPDQPGFEKDPISADRVFFETLAPKGTLRRSICILIFGRQARNGEIC